MTGQPAVPVWTLAVRLMHWSLVLSLALSTLGLWWLTGWHRPAGYAALAVALLRVLTGLYGPFGLFGLFGLWRPGRPGAPSPLALRCARFAQFVRPPRATWAYLRLLLQRREPRYLGHNPLGGWMVLALLACVAGLGLSGWLYTTDWLWGDERVEQVHTALAWLLLALVAVHVAGVIFTSLRHRENLVRAMLSGTKRPPAPDDVV